MKHWLLLSLGMSASIAGFSQITLSSDDFPDTGDTLRVSRAAIDQGIDYLTTGADVTWDFSNLVAESQKRNDYAPVSSAGALIQIAYGNFAATKYKASYYLPNTDLPFDQIPSQVPISIEDINQFSRKTADSLTLVGYSLTVNGQTIPAKSDTIEKKYEFPLEYDDMYASSGYTYLDLNPAFNGTWIQHRHRQTHVDGWGSITTPYGTFDVLRVHNVIQENDSIYASVSSFGFWIPIPVPESHEYLWLASGEKEPILRITTSLINGNETVTAIEYRDVFIPFASVEENEIEVALYPNPVQDLLTISSGKPLSSFGIFGTDGKLVLEGKLSGSQQELIDVSPLKQGTYILQLTGASGTVSRKICK